MVKCDLYPLPPTQNFLLACFKDATLYLQLRLSEPAIGDTDTRSWVTTIYVGYMPT
ncbi:hypothetical protein ACT42A_18880 (plasmid) [Acinetobacter baumannii]